MAITGADVKEFAEKKMDVANFSDIAAATATVTPGNVHIPITITQGAETAMLSVDIGPYITPGSGLETELNKAIDAGLKA